MKRGSRPAGLADIDLLDLDRWAVQGAPHHWFTRLRETAPAWWHPSPTSDGRPGFWVISRHDDVVALGRCPHILSSDADNGGVSGLGPGDQLDEDINGTQNQANPARAATNPDAKFLLTLDPPEHTTYRKIVSRGFTPRIISQLEPVVRQRIIELLDPIRPGEVVDLVEAVAMPLPMRVIGDLVGAPPHDHDKILRWTNEALAGTDPEYRQPGSSPIAAVAEMLTYFGDLRDARARQPRQQEDLISVLMAATPDGSELSDLRFRMFLFLLAAAGSETTRTAISHGVLALAERRDQWHRLRQDPGLIPHAVEEILRWASPVLYFRRNVLAPLEVAGQAIEPGETLSLWYVSANRDESRFAEPGELNVGRDPNPHVAFGGGGPHFCLGASLARLELRVVLEELLSRYQAIELTGPVDRLRSNFIHGIKHLPVTFT